MISLGKALKAVRDFAIEFDAMTHHAKYGLRPTEKKAAASIRHAD